MIQTKLFFYIIFHFVRTNYLTKTTRAVFSLFVKSDISLATPFLSGHRHFGSKKWPPSLTSSFFLTNKKRQNRHFIFSFLLIGFSKDHHERSFLPFQSFFLLCRSSGYVAFSSSSTYNASQKHESTLLHKYVLNEFLTADHSFITKYFRKNSHKSW